ncbi:MAG: hypothetical protein B7Z58_06480 [Acidiphilium sp. 37-64-53]|nr:MAG: hypothetical protein B7Z58_06480 [Acidiphilium sp. 37-64-53]OZB29308.1 MAG: hypothetical protein B7X49_07370 [Acidiphilium sp. 34-64-41]
MDSPAKSAGPAAILRPPARLNPRTAAAPGRWHGSCKLVGRFIFTNAAPSGRNPLTAKPLHF